MKPLIDILRSEGLGAGSHLMVHSSFRALRNALPGLTMGMVIGGLQDLVGRDGSLLFPTFTYCFHKRSGRFDRFHPATTPAKTGAIAEAFRTSPGVIRTAAPTHSFALWGGAARAIGPDNAPESPLGAGSPLDWLAGQDRAVITLVGVDFTALSFVHYLETLAPVPWADRWCWDHLEVDPVGVNATGEQPLREGPGCSRAFNALRDALRERGAIGPKDLNGMTVWVLPVTVLMSVVLDIVRRSPEILLCPTGSCAACDSRR